MAEWTKVTIDFDTSHLIFPTIIGTVLAVLGLWLVIRERRAILAAPSYWSKIFSDMDKMRFFGALVLTLIYFTLMVPVGNFWPNTGLGFLICSIPYVFFSGVLFMKSRPARQLATLAVIAAAAPALVWWTFTDLFFLSLP